MKWRKVIGWLLFALGLLFPYIIGETIVGKAITGHVALDLFISILVMSGGWFLAHPKKKE